MIEKKYNSINKIYNIIYIRNTYIKYLPLIDLLPRFNSVMFPVPSHTIPVHEQRLAVFEQFHEGNFDWIFVLFMSLQRAKVSEALAKNVIDKNLDNIRKREKIIS